MQCKGIFQEKMHSVETIKNEYYCSQILSFHLALEFQKLGIWAPKETYFDK